MTRLFTFIFCVFLILSPVQALLAQGVGINETGAIPDPKAILDIASSSKGLLIPRMQTSQRDAIESPPIGLQIYNTSTSTIDVFRGNRWESISYAGNGGNIVTVQSLADLPDAQGDAITLDPEKIYIFSGIVDITPYYLNLNGAAIRGTFPEKDGITSKVSGAIVRSQDQHVFIEKMAIALPPGATSAIDLSDATGEKVCNLFPGTNIVDIVGGSAGAGHISGFKYISIVNNYWRSTNGLKIGGTVGQFAFIHSIVTGITSGSGLEFLPGLSIDAIDLSNNYFTYSGQTGVKAAPSISFNHARMVTNMFSGIGNILDGFDSTTPGWEMQQNAGVPDSKVYGSLHMNDNITTTAIEQQVYTKIAGSTTSVKLERFMAPAHNQLQYVGKYPISGKLYIGVAGVSPSNGTDLKIVVAKNGQVIEAPAASIRGMSPNQSFHLSFVAEVELVTNDYIEVFLKSNITGAILITDMQLRITD